MKMQIVFDLVKLKPKKKRSWPKKRATTRERRIWEGWFRNFFSQQYRNMWRKRQTRLKKKKDLSKKLKHNLSEDRYVDRRPCSQSKLISVSPGLVSLHTRYLEISPLHTLAW